MKLNNQCGEIYIPDGVEESAALSRTTHMAIGAHQDDLEIMAYHGISSCFQSDEKYFFGCVVTNGSGSARTNIYEKYTDEEMVAIRKLEQKKAAYLGEYGALALLDYKSSEVKQKKNDALVDELSKLIQLAKPKIIYTHNPADKHDTHVAVMVKVIEALRKIPKSERPEKVYGCEIWRNLDWVIDQEKVYLDVSKHPNLAASLVEIFDSQIVGGKRYDLATIGRRLANATFNSSHEIDDVAAITYAIDLTPLMIDDTLDIRKYIASYIDDLKKDVDDRLNKFL